jgi:acyl-CoA synthetase (AMP-forming)/AMP-acid ligase II
VGDSSLTQHCKRDGWLRTGDLGYFDENGNLFVVDRLDSMLIVGGENIYPAEVERIGSSLPGAAEVVLAGVDHEIWGNELILVYQSTRNERADIRVWHRILAGQLAAHKLPQRYVSIDELGVKQFPRRENGKLNRQGLARLLREKAVGS